MREAFGDSVNFRGTKSWILNELDIKIKTNRD